MVWPKTGSHLLLALFICVEVPSFGGGVRVDCGGRVRGGLGKRAGAQAARDCEIKGGAAMGAQAGDVHICRPSGFWALRAGVSTTF